MKKGIVPLFILMAVTTATASHELLTPPGPPLHYAEVSEGSTANSGSTTLLENADALPGYPTVAHLAGWDTLPMVTASALESEGKAEQAEEGEEEDGMDKEAEDGRPDRMWGAVKLG